MHFLYTLQQQWNLQHNFWSLINDTILKVEAHNQEV